MAKKRIAILAGDGIGPEVMEAARTILIAVGDRFRHEFEFLPALAGGAAFDLHGEHLPEASIAICRQSDAILFGSVGGPVDQAHLPKWKNCEAASILKLRKTFGFYVNFRPVRVYPELIDLCPLKKEIVGDGCDILFVRELIGDIYFGEHRRGTEGGMRWASDVAEYDETKIRNVARAAFRAAQGRRRKVTSVDKANVLDTSKLWREVVAEVASEYPEVELENMLVDNCAMQIVTAPTRFDVLLTSNMFGDILSDLGAVLPGSLGMTPSASINASGFGLFEPSGGSAPDIAGQGVANPLAQILSAAMMLRWSFGMEQESALIETGVEALLTGPLRTQDILTAGKTRVGTHALTAELKKIISEM
jgi:3-isopropylmalate dehydrogenase